MKRLSSTLFRKIVWSLIAIMSILAYSQWGLDYFTKVTLTELKERTAVIARLKGHVETLSKTIGNRSTDDYENLIKAEKYITNQFENIGYKVTFQEYRADNKSVRNLIIQKQGKTGNSEPMIMPAG